MFGEFCRKCEGNSYLIGKHPKPTTNNGIENLTGDCIYVYPDLESAIFGSFKLRRKVKNKNTSDNNSDLILEAGNYGKITGIKWSNGFPLPLVSPTTEEVFSFDQATGLRIR